MKEYLIFDKVRLVTDHDSVGVITGIVTRPSVFTYLVSFGLERELEVYNQEIEKVE